MGATFSLLEGDLRLLGASYDKINPAGLRFFAGLYVVHFVHRDYLAANPWIAHDSGLNQVDRRGDWLFYQADDRLSPLRATPLDQLLARGRHDAAPREAPPGCWITGSWPVEEDTIVGGADWAFRMERSPMEHFSRDFNPRCTNVCLGQTCRPIQFGLLPPGAYRLIVLDRDQRTHVARLPDRGRPRGKPTQVPCAPARGDCSSDRDRPGPYTRCRVGMGADADEYFVCLSSGPGLWDI